MPPGRVTEAFVDFILEEASNLDDAKLTQFLEYMTTTWVDDGLYQIELWNQWHSYEDRTNNRNEAYNLRLETRLGGKSHPNIGVFIETIQKEELLVSIKIASLDQGVLKTRGRKRNDILRDLDISNSKAKYLESGKSIDDLENLLENMYHLVPNY